MAQRDKTFVRECIFLYLPLNERMEFATHKYKSLLGKVQICLPPSRSENTTFDHLPTLSYARLEPNGTFSLSSMACCK